MKGFKVSILFKISWVIFSRVPGITTGKVEGGGKIEYMHPHISNVFKAANGKHAVELRKHLLSLRQMPSHDWNGSTDRQNTENRLLTPSPVVISPPFPPHCNSLVTRGLEDVATGYAPPPLPTDVVPVACWLASILDMSPGKLYPTR